MTVGEVMVSGKFLPLFDVALKAQTDRMVVNGRPARTPDIYQAPANNGSAPSPNPDSGLGIDTMIATPNGRRKLSDLAIGDAVIGDLGQATTVTAISTSTKSCKALKLRAPYFGLDQDLLVGYDQMITVKSDAADYLSGSAWVSVPASALKDRRHVIHHELGPRDGICQIQLADATTLNVGKCLVGTDTKFGKASAKALTAQEARCFAAEYQTGYAN